YFMECTLDYKRRPSFKLSKPVIIVYKNENIQMKVEKVLSYMVVEGGTEAGESLT
ncbi:16037_t:CDS:1, partial [Racocetra persica]